MGVKLGSIHAVRTMLPRGKTPTRRKALRSKHTNANDNEMASPAFALAA